MKTNLFSNMEIADLCRQLGLLLHSGIRLSDSMAMMADEETNSTHKSLYTTIAEQLDDGFYLHAAFDIAGCFPAHVINLLKVGEEVGRLEETLFALAEYYEEREHTARQIKSSLTYPLILLSVMLVVILVLLTRVLPVFNEVYQSLGTQLTGLAGSLVSVGNWLSRTMPILGILFMLLLLLILCFTLILPLRRKALRFIQNRFGDKGVFRKLNDAHFAQALSMVISSGLPLEEGVALAGSLLAESPAAAKRCEACITALNEGQDLISAFAENNMLPAYACKLLNLGIKAGTSDQTMEKLAKRLTEDAKESLQAKLSKIEPALVLITSILVGAILLAVMLPLLNIMKAIG